MNRNNDHSTIIIDSPKLSSNRRGSRRSDRTRNVKGLGQQMATSTDSLDSISSETSTTSAISFESSPDLFFQELSSLVDLDSPNAVSYDNIDLAVNRVQSRLLDKHIKSGRLVSAMSTLSVSGAANSRRDQLGGQANQRRVRTTLSFARNPHRMGLAGAGESNAMINNPEAEVIVQGNESFNGMAANPSLRRQESNASAVAAGHALLGRR